MPELTDKEAKAVGLVLEMLAKSEGEDIIGVLMRRGIFHILPDEQLVNLAKKLEDFAKIELE